jgi:hypothetical protein
VSKTYIPVALRRLVEERASSCCEFCLLPADLAFLLSHEVDHVIAEKHGGETVEFWPSAGWLCRLSQGSICSPPGPRASHFVPNQRRVAEALLGSDDPAAQAVGVAMQHGITTAAPERPETI